MAGEGIGNMKQAAWSYRASGVGRSYWLAEAFPDEPVLAMSQGGLQFRALVPYFTWYQHLSSVREIERRRPKRAGDLLRRRSRERER